MDDNTTPPPVPPATPSPPPPLIAPLRVATTPSPKRGRGAWPAIASREHVDGLLREQMYESAFSFAKRFMGGLAFTIVGLAGHFTGAAAQTAPQGFNTPLPTLPGLTVLQQPVANAIDEVQRGSALSRSLSVSPLLFPPSVVEMVAVAEETGRLDKELIRLSGAYEGELDRRLRMLVALAEPVLLFIMAGLIGTVVVGMLLPVFTLQDLVH